MIPELEGRPAWHRHAACRGKDPATYFPTRKGRPNAERSRTVKETCGACPVAAECLRFAIGNRERYGIWAATTSRQRLRIAREAAA